MWNYSINQTSYASYRCQVFHNIVMLLPKANWDNTNTNESQQFIEQQFLKKTFQISLVCAQNLRFKAFLSSKLASLLANLDPLSALERFALHLMEELGFIPLSYYCFFSCFYILTRIPLVIKSFLREIMI